MLVNEIRCLKGGSISAVDEQEQDTPYDNQPSKQKVLSVQCLDDMNSFFLHKADCEYDNQHTQHQGNLRDGQAQLKQAFVCEYPGIECGEHTSDHPKCGQKGIRTGEYPANADEKECPGNLKKLPAETLGVDMEPFFYPPIDRFQEYAGGDDSAVPQTVGRVFPT